VDDILNEMDVTFDDAVDILNRTKFQAVSEWAARFTESQTRTSVGWGWGDRGPFLTSPLGANFDPRGEIVPQG
jgi:hypothetical protein